MSFSKGVTASVANDNRKDSFRQQPSACPSLQGKYHSACGAAKLAFLFIFSSFFLLILFLFFFNHGTGLAGKVINMLRGSAGWSRTRELSKSHAQLFKAGLLEINIIVVNYNSNLWEVEHESRGLSHPQLYIMSFKSAEALRDLDSKHKNKNRYPLKIQNKLFLFASKK